MFSQGLVDGNAHISRAVIAGIGAVRADEMSAAIVLNRAQEGETAPAVRNPGFQQAPCAGEACNGINELDIAGAAHCA